VTDALGPIVTERDPSVPLAIPLAVAAVLHVADPGGRVTFGELAVACRERYLEASRRAGLEAGAPAGTLSVDEVRQFLLSSVLPRLVTYGILEELPPTVEDESVLQVRPERWGALLPERALLGERLIALAIDRMVEVEAAGVVPRPSGSVLAGRGLTKVYRRRRVVDDVHVKLQQGEIVGLLGPNGAGKTTTFYMIVGLIRPDAGRIFVDDQDISNRPMYRRAREGIGYLAQEPSVFRKLTVEENVLAIMETLGLSRADREQRLESLLDELSIKHLRREKAYKLSGGERRRLEITRALVTEPRFMLLDEPFAGVDPIAVHDIQSIVADLRRRGIGVLITDHNVEQTLDIVDRAYILFEGRVQVAGTVRELVFNDRVADLYLGPTLTARLRERLGAVA
jgi:lipopolysaccharide export system ATP-binding protein